jgi:hypothetical protein
LGRSYWWAVAAPDEPNLPMPLGVRAALDADALTITLLEPAVDS